MPLSILSRFPAEARRAPTATALFARALAVLILAVAFAAPAAAVTEGKRVALVIGNGAYDELGTLPNPPNDARAMAAALEGLDFEVFSVVDGDIDLLTDTLRQFGRAAVNADVALFYYAGHGMALGGENYLLPIGAEIEIERDLRYETLSLSDVRLELEDTGATLSMIILDACRDNPLGRALKRNAAQLGRNIDPGEGLAPVEVSPASGMLIAYATAPGNVAFDGADQPNSPFTAALLQHIAEPNVDVRVMFGHVRKTVVEATQALQTPWVEDGMLGEFQFNPVAEPEPEPSTPADVTAWTSISASEDPADFEAFLETYPESVIAGAARDRLALLNDPEAELEAWSALVGSSDVDAHERFLRRWPSGQFSDAASVKLQALLWKDLGAAADVARLESFLERFPDGPFAPVAVATIESLKARPAAAPAAPPVATAAPPAAPPATAAAPTPAEPEPAREPAALEPQRALILAPPPDDAAAKAALARANQLQPHLIQQALAALGYYDGAIDGQFGPASRRAAAEFQTRAGYPATGELKPGEIVALIRQAAESGNPESMNTYGIMFGYGLGVVRDHAEAAKWFRRSADSNDGHGQMNLALLYLDGLGVPRDRAEARRLLEAADANGVPEARPLLRQLD